MNNDQFTWLFRNFSKALPFLAILVLFANYFGAGLATFLFLKMELTPVIGAIAAGSLAGMVGGGVQGLRGVIVYFDLMTPNRLSFNRLPELIALLFTVFTIIEMKLLVDAVGLNLAVYISLCGLQVAGLVAEIFLLRQFRYHINYQLSMDNKKVLEIVNTNRNIANLEAYTDKLQEAMREKGQYIELPDFAKDLAPKPEKRRVVKRRPVSIQYDNEAGPAPTPSDQPISLTLKN